MPAVIIQNPSIEPVGLPYPFRGVLKGRQEIKLETTKAVVEAALGTNGALLVRETDDDAAPFDTFYQGDLLSGANKQTVGPFHETLAAAQTDNPVQQGFVAMRAGQVVGLAANLSAAITGAGTTVTAFVTINGTPVTGLSVQFTQAGAETALADTVDAGEPTAQFDAGDVIVVEYTSTGISNTPTLAASVQIADA